MVPRNENLLNTVVYDGGGDFPRGNHGGSAMGKRVGNEKVTREPGYLYYVGKDGFVWRTPMKANKKGTKKKVGNEKIAKKSGYLYYLDEAGFVAEAKMKNA